MSQTPEQQRRMALHLAAFRNIVNSVPNVREPGEHGPLTLDEIDQAAALMDEIAAEAAAEREPPG